METAEIETKVIKVITDQLGEPKDGPIKRESNLSSDLGADSLDTVEIVMNLEDAFDIHIPDDKVEKVKTVGDVIDFVKSVKG